MPRELRVQRNISQLRTEDIEKSLKDCSVILELLEAVLNKNSNFLMQKEIKDGINAWLLMKLLYC